MHKSILIYFDARLPKQVKVWDRRLASLELHHGYGLFRCMLPPVTMLRND